MVDISDLDYQPVWQTWESTPRTVPLLTRRADVYKDTFEPCGRGVSVCPLNVDRERNQMTALFRLEPGATWRAHHHSDVEECYVLEGDLHYGNDILRTGDYQRALAGSEHEVESTESGCLLLVRCSLTDKGVEKTTEILEEKVGVVTRINDDVGFGYVQEENSSRQFGFSFDKIPTYRGQSARELNLHRGTSVRFKLEGEIVKSIVPT